MKVLIAFLMGMFMLSASPRVRRHLDRPVVFIAICTIVAASFYSLRISG